MNFSDIPWVRYYRFRPYTLASIDQLSKSVLCNSPHFVQIFDAIIRMMGSSIRFVDRSGRDVDITDIEKGIWKPIILAVDTLQNMGRLVHLFRDKANVFVTCHCIGNKNNVQYQFHIHGDIIGHEWKMIPMATHYSQPPLQIDLSVF